MCDRADKNGRIFGRMEDYENKNCEYDDCGGRDCVHCRRYFLTLYGGNGLGQSVGV